MGKFFSLFDAERSLCAWPLRAEFLDFQGKLAVLRNWHAACKNNNGNNAPNAFEKEFGKKRTE